MLSSAPEVVPAHPAATELRIGPIAVDPPVVLAPMAGVTNAAFRRLCREYGAVITVAEMVTSQALVVRNREAMRIVTADPDEAIRSVQVYGVQPSTVGEAVRILVDEDRADHIDLNFGCPAPKVTRRGGGAALPWKSELFRAIVQAAVANAGDVPVTVKMRMGIDDEHLTYLEAGRQVQDLGVAAVALHARTAAQYYSGKARWAAIGELKSILDIPVLGNGDIWTAEDGLAMMARTGCDGIVIGRGCQGRPWLFADLAAAFAGSPNRVRPSLAEVGATILRHGTLMVKALGDEHRACRDLRKHMAWYLHGYPVGGAMRRRLAQVGSLTQLAELIEEMGDGPYPGPLAEGPRGRAGSERQVHLPYGWLKSRQLDNGFRAELAKAEQDVSGG